MLTGRLPFTGATAAILNQHQHVAPTPPSTHNAAVPEQLDLLILDLLAKQPTARPQSAEHVRERLRAASV